MIHGTAEKKSGLKKASSAASSAKDAQKKAAKEKSAPRTRKPKAATPPLQEPDTSSSEREFMLAMQEYKKSSGRMFPTWSEVLEVLQGLGYRKIAAASVDFGSEVP